MNFYTHVRSASSNQTNITYRPITSSGLFSIHNSLEHTDWSFINDGQINAGQLFDRFVNSIVSLISMYLPIKQQKILDHNTKFANWFSPKLKQMRET